MNRQSASMHCVVHPVVQAYADGATVQRRIHKDLPWEDDNDPNFNAAWHWRVKPDEPEKKSLVVLFTSRNTVSGRINTNNFHDAKEGTSLWRNEEVVRFIECPEGFEVVPVSYRQALEAIAAIDHRNHGHDFACALGHELAKQALYGDPIMDSDPDIALWLERKRMCNLPDMPAPPRGFRKAVYRGMGISNLRNYALFFEGMSEWHMGFNTTSRGLEDTHYIEFVK